MDIQFYGANCLGLVTKHARLIVDDNLAELGAKGVIKEGDVVLYTATHPDPAQTAKLVIDQPGEYEVSGISVHGIVARSHMDEDKAKTATMYKIMTEDLSILVTGHVYPELSDVQLEAIGMVDVLFIPVGGNGYTLDGIGALALIKKIDPKLVIPTHYADSKLNFPVPQQPLADALHALAMEPKEEPTSKLRIKHSDLTEGLQLVVLERS
jgi:hypothetical protein